MLGTVRSVEDCGRVLKKGIGMPFGGLAEHLQHVRELIGYRNGGVVDDSGTIPEMVFLGLVELESGQVEVLVTFLIRVSKRELEAFEGLFAKLYL